MAESKEKEKEKSAPAEVKAAPKAAAPAPAPQAAAPAAPAEQQRVEVNEASAQVCYANFCRVSGTPEELIIDFGLNSQPCGAPTKPLDVNQRLVINYFTAKRLLGALQLSVQRHEAAFGVLETNVQKRVLPAAMRQMGG
jgi:hypothetical protein